MTQKQTSISIVGKMAPVVEEALRTFPDSKKPGQALTRALFHWYHNRQENSKSAALKRIENLVQDGDAELKALLLELKEQNNLETSAILNNLIAIEDKLNASST